MRKNKMILLTVMLCLISSTAFAATSNHIFETGLPIDDILTTMQKAAENWGFQICGIMMLISGLMLAIGSMPMMKTAFQFIIGTGLAIHFGYLLYAVFEPYLTTPGIEQVVPSPSFDIKLDSASDFNLLSKFMTYYIVDIIGPAAERIKPYALSICVALAAIEGTLSIAFDVVKGDKFQYICTTMVKVGIYIWLISNWIGGEYMIAARVFSSFELLGLKASGNEMLQVDSIVGNAVEIVGVMWDSVSAFGIKDIVPMIFSFIFFGIAIYCLIICALEIFTARIEFWTVSLLSIVLLPFGALKQTKFLAEKAIALIFNHAIKVSLISFISAIIGPMVTNLVGAMQKDAGTGGISANNLAIALQMAVAALLMLFLVKKIPEMIVGFLNGTPQLSGGQLSQHLNDVRRGVTDTVKNLLDKGGELKGSWDAGKKSSGSGFKGLQQYLGRKLPGMRAYQQAMDNVTQQSNKNKFK